MVKHFRVSGSLRVRLEEAGILVPAVLRGAGLPQNLSSRLVFSSLPKSSLPFGVRLVK